MAAQQPLMVPVQPATIVAQQQQPRNPVATKRLAIAQFVLGILCCILGVASTIVLHSDFTFATGTSAGIWSGGWIVFTGIIGMCHTRNLVAVVRWISANHGRLLVLSGVRFCRLRHHHDLTTCCWLLHDHLSRVAVATTATILTTTHHRRNSNEEFDPQQDG